MKNNLKRSLGYVAVGSLALSALLISGTAFAAGPGSHRTEMGSRIPGIFGTVSAINGTTFTVMSEAFNQNKTATTYTVDATHATVMKAGESSSLANIAVGDTVRVQGTVSDTNVTATAIHESTLQGQGPRGLEQRPQQRPQQNVTPIIQGDGQPVVEGTVTAVSGSTLIITNKNNVTYTIDATNATIAKGNTASTISEIAVGDDVMVQGAVNGNSITASSVMDSRTNPSANVSAFRSGFGGMLDGIGGFFHEMFGFF